MYDALKDGKWDDYYSSLSQVYIPLLLMGVFQLLFWGIEIVQIFCRFYCKYLERDYNQEPFAKGKFYFLLYFTTFFGIAVIIVSSLQLQFTKYLQPSVEFSTCSILNELDIWIYGDDNQTWFGTIQIDDKVKSSVEQLKLNFYKFQQTFTTAKTGFLQDVPDVYDFITDIENQFTGNSALVVNVPNPRRTVIKQVYPDIIESMGSQDILDLNEVLGGLEFDYETKTLIESDSLEKCKDSCEYIINNYDDLIKNYTDYQEAFIDFNNNFQDLKKNATNALEYYHDIENDIQNYGDTVSSICLVASIVGIIGLWLAYFLKISFFRIFVYTTWFVLGICSIFFWVLSIYSYSHSIMYWELCDSVEKYINEENYYSDFHEFIGNEQAKTCFYGNGDLDESFNMVFDLQVVEEVKEDIETLLSLDYLYTDDISDWLIYDWVENVEQYIAFQEEAIEQSAQRGYTYGDLPSEALDKMNSWSNIDYVQNSGQQNDQESMNCRELTRDKIVFLKSDCNGINNPQSYSDLIQNNACIYLEGIVLNYLKTDPTLITSTDPLYDINFIEQRLNSITGVTCSKFEEWKDNYLTYYTYLYTYTQSMLEIVAKENTSVYAYLNEFERLNKDTQQKLVALQEDITNNLYPKIQTFLSIVSDDQYGILGNLNCSFMKNATETMMKSFCENHMVRMYHVSAAQIAGGIVSMLMSTGLYFLSGRIQHYIIKTQQDMIKKKKKIQETNFTNPYFNDYIKSKNNQNEILAEYRQVDSNINETSPYKRNKTYNNLFDKSRNITQNNLDISELEEIQDEENSHHFNQNTDSKQIDSKNRLDNQEVKLKANQGGIIKFKNIELTNLDEEEKMKIDFVRKNFGGEI
ncbi:hypothetical protein PPERSA_07191 [Pseudocohnilembus persalinus]|uniref:Transmembrane protein n=1 Tax=Pseudocohnilembus persalinus TaxID=266149 RepID=A0A0V0QXU7_PSEPJ|nr:hypothetical protein PPERSA_07191 [Pseudocohnilembus persalinus]|eukprot:KRX07028.1 hypothetical protein PPERSA_07191 [Pseudocohnilembus persalinus]